ncbi:MAG: DUF6655 family protein [Gemmataceae bacterium]
MRGGKLLRALVVSGVLTTLSVGCGTTRMTDTSRSATEMLLISQAIDQSINQLDFTVLSGKSVFFDEKVLDGVTDKGYLASSLRAKMLADGCLLVEDRTKSTYVVEARAGCVGTDKHSLLVGIPQMNLPTIMPGQPPAIPEMPIVKSTDQQGVAKVLVFAYNRVTGQAVWQSGVQESVTRSKDTWVCGTGPFQKGTIRKRIETPLEQMDVLGVMGNGEQAVATNGRVSVTQAACFMKEEKSGDIQRVSAPALPASPVTPAAASVPALAPTTAPTSVPAPLPPVPGFSQPAK